MPTRKYSTAPVGTVLGKWTVLSYSHAEYLTNRQVPRWLDYWLCRCECGHEQTVEANGLMHAYSHNLSRGCFKCGREESGKKLTKHGHSNKDSRSPEYGSWGAMKQRCLNPNHESYHHYAKRGITVCAAWVNSFAQFLADMGLKPTPAHEIERRDNNLGYFPENCYWATRQEQTHNTRRTRKFSHNGETLVMSEWARRANIHRATFRMHIENGKSVGEILAMNQ